LNVQLKLVQHKRFAAAAHQLCECLLFKQKLPASHPRSHVSFCICGLEFCSSSSLLTYSVKERGLGNSCALLSLYFVFRAVAWCCTHSFIAAVRRPKSHAKCETYWN